MWEAVQKLQAKNCSVSYQRLEHCRFFIIIIIVIIPGPRTYFLTDTKSQLSPIWCKNPVKDQRRATDFLL